MAAPTAEDIARESAALRVSIVGTALLGVMGVAWGVVSGSQMILLDGVYAVIGIATTGLLMRASFLARTGPTGRYPFGREAATPLAIGIQGVVLTATLGYAALEAVFTILDGGSDVTAGSGIAYSVIDHRGEPPRLALARRAGRYVRRVGLGIHGLAHRCTARCRHDRGLHDPACDRGLGAGPGRAVRGPGDGAGHLRRVPAHDPGHGPRHHASSCWRVRRRHASRRPSMPPSPRSRPGSSSRTSRSAPARSAPSSTWRWRRMPIRPSRWSRWSVSGPPSTPARSTCRTTSGSTWTSDQPPSSDEDA